VASNPPPPPAAASQSAGTDAVTASATLLRWIWSRVPLVRLPIAHLLATAAASVAQTLGTVTLRTTTRIGAGGGAVQATLAVPDALVHARYYGVVLERLRAELGQLDGRPGPGGGGSGGRAAGADHPLLWSVQRGAGGRHAPVDGRGGGVGRDRGVTGAPAARGWTGGGGGGGRLGGGGGGRGSSARVARPAPSRESRASHGGASRASAAARPCEPTSKPAAGFTDAMADEDEAPVSGEVRWVAQADGKRRAAQGWSRGL
jgi:hypothetical protein